VGGGEKSGSGDDLAAKDQNTRQRQRQKTKKSTYHLPRTKNPQQGVVPPCCWVKREKQILELSWKAKILFNPSRVQVDQKKS